MSTVIQGIGADAIESLGSVNRALMVFNTAIPSAENALSGMYNASPVWKKVRVTATGLVSAVGAGRIFGGLSYISGTAPTAIAYDALTADTTNQLWAGAAPVVDRAPVNCLGNASSVLTFGVELTNGLFLTLGGTSPVLWVWYR